MLHLAVRGNTQSLPKILCTEEQFFAVILNVAVHSSKCRLRSPLNHACINYKSQVIYDNNLKGSLTATVTIFRSSLIFIYLFSQKVFWEDLRYEVLSAIKCIIYNGYGNSLTIYIHIWLIGRFYRFLTLKFALITACNQRQR